ncbi:MAG: hypothetical protein DRP16_05880 [Candidatus Aenigmatarchaeota archaeon]|nr:MAG: hypothetical protein DRP16_05880 [Candidatus Aenigmarchaeota archaeon]
MRKWIELKGGKREIVLCMSKPNPFNKQDPKTFRVSHLGKMTGFKLPTINQHLRELNHMGIVNLEESSTIEKDGFRVFRRIKSVKLNAKKVRITKEYKIKEDVIYQAVPVFPGLILVTLIYIFSLSNSPLLLLVAAVFTASVLLKIMFDIKKSPQLTKVYVSVAKKAPSVRAEMN